MKKFKKVVLCLALTSVVSAFSIVGGASATATTAATAATTTESVTITDLGPNANDALFASIASQSNNQNDMIIKPLATDGRNISYSFAQVSTFVKTDALPTSTYGTVPLKLVQYTPSKSSVASFTYQFSNISGTKKTTVQQVTADIESPAETLTFYNVPEGTASDPIYLFIVQKGTDNFNFGNGYTAY
ncbi:hypothetical protein YDYSG_04460 [Paenibacillus tyrfis]|uniref:hypothetical protein n=1 Tax=Paenibacillus tyrfis TaxID=1501230 RepID=UPI002491F466|nr:hypothetical protein [Paenibacillus tyrfis]GLI04416.1 hypothetical protein YDYSG_04460 [Paenibacillus tyrfis]